MADPSGTQIHPVRSQHFCQRLEEAILHSQNTQPPCSLYPQLVKSYWQCGWTKKSKGLEKHDEEILERNSSETEDFDITHLQSGMIKNFYIICWHLRPPCSPINWHISDRILNNLEARAGCSLLRFQADMQLLGLL